MKHVRISPENLYLLTKWQNKNKSRCICQWIIITLRQRNACKQACVRYFLAHPVMAYLPASQLPFCILNITDVYLAYDENDASSANCYKLFDYARIINAVIS